MTLFHNSGKRARLISTVLLFVVFIAGALAGAAGERVLRADDTPQRSERGPEMRGGTRRLLLDEQFARELQLTEQQRAQIKSIFERRDRQARKVWNEAEPRLKAVGEETRNEVQKILSAAQQQKLDAALEQRRQAWKERHKCHSDSTAVSNTDKK